MEKNSIKSELNLYKKYIGVDLIAGKAPWKFSGETLNLYCSIDRSYIRDIVPEEFMLDDKVIINFAISNMSSVPVNSNSKEFLDSFDFSEFLIKIQTTYNDERYWYSPLGIVNKDFSLMRGIFLGFTKSFGEIKLVKTKDISDKNDKKTKCSFNIYKDKLVNISGDLTIEKSKREKKYSKMKFITLHGIPDYFQNKSYGTRNEICTLVTSGYKMNQVNHSTVNLFDFSFSNNSYLSFLNMLELIDAEFQNEEFVVHGIKAL